MPVVILRASDFGKTGYETPAELDADKISNSGWKKSVFSLVERMGLGDVHSKVVPKMTLIAPPRAGWRFSDPHFYPAQMPCRDRSTGGGDGGNGMRVARFRRLRDLGSAR